MRVGGGVLMCFNQMFNQIFDVHISEVNVLPACWCNITWIYINVFSLSDMTV